MIDENLPPLRGIHHVKFAVSDVDTSLDFYQRALGARHLPELDHARDDGSRYAAILQMPGLDTMLELRRDPKRVARQAAFAPLHITVDDRAALHRWDAALTARGVLHSPVLANQLAWLIVIEDPDVDRFVADDEAIYSSDGAREMNTLIVGRSLTGLSAFV